MFIIYTSMNNLLKHRLSIHMDKYICYFNLKEAHSVLNKRAGCQFLEKFMKFIKAFLMALILTLTTTASFAGYDFSERQIANMQKAYHFGESKGHKKYNGTHLSVGYIMAAILWQESSCGINIKNGHAVGAFQNYIPTVKSRMKQNGVNKSSAQISNELSNFNTSAHWANVELDSWLKTHRGNMPKALASYNAGYNVGAGRGYSNQIIRKATYLQKNNVLKVE